MLTKQIFVPAHYKGAAFLCSSQDHCKRLSIVSVRYWWVDLWLLSLLYYIIKGLQCLFSSSSRLASSPAQATTLITWLKDSEAH